MTQQEMAAFRTLVREQEQRLREEGKAEGKAEDVLRVLASRGLAVSAEQRTRLETERSLVTLDMWLLRAVTAAQTHELFDAPSA